MFFSGNTEWKNLVRKEQSLGIGHSAEARRGESHQVESPGCQSHRAQLYPESDASMQRRRIVYSHISRWQQRVQFAWGCQFFLLCFPLHKRKADEKFHVERGWRWLGATYSVSTPSLLLVNGARQLRPGCVGKRLRLTEKLTVVTLTNCHTEHERQSERLTLHKNGDFKDVTNRTYVWLLACKVL